MKNSIPPAQFAWGNGERYRGQLMKQLLVLVMMAALVSGIWFLWLRQGQDSPPALPYPQTPNVPAAEQSNAGNRARPEARSGRGRAQRTDALVCSHTRPHQHLRVGQSPANDRGLGLIDEST